MWCNLPTDRCLRISPAAKALNARLPRPGVTSTCPIASAWNKMPSVICTTAFLRLITSRSGSSVWSPSQDAALILYLGCTQARWHDTPLVIELQHVNRSGDSCCAQKSIAAASTNTDRVSTSLAFQLCQLGALYIRRNIGLRSRQRNWGVCRAHQAVLAEVKKSQAPQLADCCWQRCQPELSQP